MAKIRTRTQAQPTAQVEPRKVLRARDGETLDGLVQRATKALGDTIRLPDVALADVLGEESEFGNGALFADESGGFVCFMWAPRVVHRRSAYNPKTGKGGNAHSVSTGGFVDLGELGYPGCRFSVNSMNLQQHRPVANCSEAKIRDDDKGPSAKAPAYVDDD